MDTPCIDIHTHSRKPGSICLVSYSLGRDVIPRYPEKPFTAGIHPWDACKLAAAEYNEYLSYLRTAPVAAIGEIGLDYIHGGDRSRQREVFTGQLDVAKSRDLPVVIHCVRAYNDLFAIINKYPQTDFILHGYIGSTEQTAQALRLGCSISIGPLSLHSPKTIQSVRAIPADSIFAETDQSDIPITWVYERIAGIKDMQISDLTIYI